VGTYVEYQTLVDRCAAWTVEDLGDLLHEIDRDRELAERERAELQSRVYRLIWDRAQPRLRRSAASRAAPRPPPNDEVDPP
jgi:hypothetical protein